MTEETISIRQMLIRMESGEIGTFRVVKYNRRLGTGGDILVIKQGFLQKKDRDMGKAIRKELAQDTQPMTPTAISKNPRHYINYTRNLHILENGRPTNRMIKIHPSLILNYNGLKVVP